ncbi:acetolactate synthase small subunit [Brytella acorum]|uniref:Acetolactate synthase small subunit n=1 Tax=Brytella acorum TaxID=2959299 RepID=A0AA35UZN2_9PROT|nr:acetolactate synthase small subunit [Brytella acorum]MDF3623567.1 acetolactate synthase small subunit [Brytella acorum]CAI9120015.1 acetolactate synthase small subunit [Brytella acorum]
MSNVIQTAVIAVLIENEAGALGRVVGLFSGRGYNIESLTVSVVDPSEKISRITIVTSGTPMVIAQIKAQLARIIPVHGVTDLTASGPYVAREMALVKVISTGDARTEGMRIADAFRARIVDTTAGSFVFEMTGAPEKIDAFVDLMRPLGLAEVSRTGVAAIARGLETFHSNQESF